MAHSHVLRLGHLDTSGHTPEAIKGTVGLTLKARFEVSGVDETFSEVETAVLLADANFRGDLNFELLRGLNSLKAIKSATCLSLGALVNVEGSDETLSSINTAVLLADAHVSSD